MLGGVDIRIATPNATLRGDGAQARPVRRRRHDRPAAPPARLPGGHGVPAHRRGVPGRRGRSSSGCSTRSSSPSELMDRALEWAGRITANAPLAVQATKESVLRGLAGDARRGATRSSRSCRRRSSPPRTPRRARRRSPRSATRWQGAEQWPSDASTRARRASSASPSARGTRRRRAGARAAGDVGRGRAARPPPTRSAARRRARRRSTALQIVYCLSWPYDDPAGRLADALGIDPAAPPLLGHRRHDAAAARVGRGGRAILRGELDVGGRRRAPRRSTPCAA